MPNRPAFTPVMKDQPAGFDAGSYRYPIPGVDNWQPPVPLLRTEGGNQPPPPPFYQNSLPTVSWLCSCPLCVTSVQDFMSALRNANGLYSANIATSGPVYNALLTSVMQSNNPAIPNPAPIPTDQAPNANNTPGGIENSSASIPPAPPSDTPRSAKESPSKVEQQQQVVDDTASSSTAVAVVERGDGGGNNIVSGLMNGHGFPGGPGPSPSSYFYYSPSPSMYYPNPNSFMGMRMPAPAQAPAAPAPFYGGGGGGGYWNPNWAHSGNPMNVPNRPPYPPLPSPPFPFLEGNNMDINPGQFQPGAGALVPITPENRQAAVMSADANKENKMDIGTPTENNDDHQSNVNDDASDSEISV